MYICIYIYIYIYIYILRSLCKQTYYRSEQYFDNYFVPFVNSSLELCMDIYRILKHLCDILRRLVLSDGVKFRSFSVPPFSS